MIDIPSIFKNKTLHAESLVPFGFTQTEFGYCKAYPILKGQFIAKIQISSEGQADFKVFEAETGEEYMPAHVYHSTGAFVGTVHAECAAILKEIADKCYTAECFKEDQSKRILRFIKENYHAQPEFLWSSFPECAALRVPGKKPWFAMVGRIPKDKIGIRDGGIAEVINLKDEPKTVAARIAEKKAFPAYHMNKQHWYTVLLDNSLTDAEILSFVKTSYDIVNA